MALLGFLLFLLILWLSDLNQRIKIRDKAKEMEEQGAYLPRDFRRHEVIFQDVYRDWYNERKLFPEEYHLYFDRNKEALNSYISALVSDKEAKEGLCPVLCVGSYNKYTYDAFKGFHTLYDEKIKRYNETGVYYF